MFQEVLRLVLRHGYYDPEPIPVTVVQDDAGLFMASGLVIRASDWGWHILTDRDDFPEEITLDLVAKRSDLLTVTQGAQWQRVPIIEALIDDDFPVLDTDSPPTLPRDPKGALVLAHLRVALNEVARVIELRFMPILAHWAYHIVGEGAEVSEVYDPDGVVEFAALPSTTLPDGRPVTVLCSTRALPARARAPYRFALRIPGPFGPQTLIPVLPAPGPDFVSLADPGSATPRVQSNIYVSIV